MFVQRRAKTTIAEAVRQARADLRLENMVAPEWSRQIFSRVEKGELSLTDARLEIDKQVQTLIHAR